MAGINLSHGTDTIQDTDNTWNHSEKYKQLLKIKELEENKNKAWKPEEFGMGIFGTIVGLYFLYHSGEKIYNDELGEYISSAELEDYINISLAILISALTVLSWKEALKYTKSQVREKLQVILGRPEVGTLDDEKKKLKEELSNDEKSMLVDEGIAKI